jgi:2-polyprenyl-3-methyl-5-hydroxy-6-metoxy-1,4-benzoquinol methylase
MLSRIPLQLLDRYRPLSTWESFYLRTRWRLCPFEVVESHVPRKGRILDFGCGYGMLSNFLALKSPNRQVLGIYLNRARIEVAKRSSKGHPEISFQLGDVRDSQGIPFDAVVMTDVLHHIDDANVRVLLQVIRSCLSDHGTLVVLDVDRSPIRKFYTTYLIDRLLNLNRTLHYRSRDLLTHLLDQTGFRVHHALPADRGLPLSDVIYLCKKGKNEPSARLRGAGIEGGEVLASGTRGKGCGS